MLLTEDTTAAVESPANYPKNFSSIAGREHRPTQEQDAHLRAVVDPEFCAEIRILKCDEARDGRIVRGDRFKSTYGGWSPDRGVISRWASKLDGVSGYITINPVNPALLSRSNKLEKQSRTTSDDEIVCLRHVLVDIDPKRPADISATDNERLASLECRDTILAAHPEIKAAALWGCSGNGAWILVRIPDYPNDKTHASLVERFIKSLGALYSGTYSGVKVEVDPATHNPARIMALSGTKKCKGVSTEDRPHRLVTLDSPLGAQPASLELIDWLPLHAPHTPCNGVPHKENIAARSPDRDTVFDDFGERADWFGPELFAGVQVCRTLANGERQLTRPGKDQGPSGTIGHEGRDIFHVFSSEWPPFEAQKNYTKSQAYAWLHHNGDMAKAALALEADGYGRAKLLANGVHHSSESTATVTAIATANPETEATAQGDERVITFKLITTKLSLIKPEPVEYLVEGYLFRGKVNLIAGPAGRGKSTLIYDQVTSHTLGRPAFGLSYVVKEPFEVLVFAGEEYFADTIVPRLLGAGANLGMVMSIDGVMSSLGKKSGFHFGYIEALRSELKNNPRIKLVLMDPITSLITGTGADQNNEGEVRALLEQLKLVAEDTGVTFEAVKNFNKDETRSAASRVSGTHAYVDVCRANYVIDKDPDDDTRRIFSPIKVNGPDQPSSFAFSLQVIPQDEALQLLAPYDHLTHENRLKLASQLRRPVYEGKTKHTAEDLVKKHVAPESSTARNKAATEWLRSRLENGPVGSLLVAKEGDLFLGIGKPTGDLKPDEKRKYRLGRTKWWRETILKDKLGGASQKLGCGKVATPWFFRLPGDQWPPSSDAIRAALDEDPDFADASMDDCSYATTF